MISNFKKLYKSIKLFEKYSLEFFSLFWVLQATIRQKNNKPPIDLEKKTKQLIQTKWSYIFGLTVREKKQLTKCKHIFLSV
jgi:hypothetical protein